MSNIWFTADMHLGHDNIRKFCNRPFESVDEMDKKLISNWNEVVGENDTIYHLGDFCFGDSHHYKNSLNGMIIFIRGSHDIIADPYMMIIEPTGLLDEYGNKRTIVLCHYAMRSWPLSHYASWHLFGHHHGRLEEYGLSFDVGTDTNNFYPYSLKGVEKRMSKLTPIVDFRGKQKNG